MNILRTSFCTLIVAILLSACNSDNPKGQHDKAPTVWTQQTFDDGRFTISFPSEPKFQNGYIETSFGSLTSSIYMAWEEGTYLAAYYDLPDELNDSLDTPQKLKMARDLAFSAVEGEIVQEHVFEERDLHGHEMTIKVANGTTMFYRLYSVNERIYTVAFTTPHEYFPGKADAIEKYVNSFKIV